MLLAGLLAVSCPDAYSCSGLGLVASLHLQQMLGLAAVVLLVPATLRVLGVLGLLEWIVL